VLDHSLDLFYGKTKPTSLLGIHHSADGRVIHSVNVLFVMRPKLRRIRLPVDFFNELFFLRGSVRDTQLSDRRGNFGLRGAVLHHRSALPQLAQSTRIGLYDVIQYERHLAQAESAAVSARGAYAKSKSALERVVGLRRKNNDVDIEEAYDGKNISSVRRVADCVNPLGSVNDSGHSKARF
jgi:hypothetical protein